MPLVEWNTSFSVQNIEMDQQHQRLFGLLNQLHEAMGQGKGKETLPQIFDGLIDYTKKHFAAEEAFLQKYNYPDLATQKRQHVVLIEQIYELKKKFLAGDLSSSLQTHTFLKGWLVEHIQKSDLKYGAFLDQKGIH
jgi:hemerythrin